MTTKILALSDTLAILVGFELLPGQRHDTVGVAALVAGQDFGALIADKAFDADWIIEELERRDAEVVISQHPICKLKACKRVALRACKPDSSFAAMIHASAAVIQSR